MFYTSTNQLQQSEALLNYFVLILISLFEPFFLFFNREKDLGMPPRRQAPVYEEPVYDASQMNFWDTEDKDYL